MTTTTTKPKTTQSIVLGLAKRSRSQGITVKELRENHADLGHHGTLSAALSLLALDGSLVRLNVKRDGCSLYVTPQWVKGRTVLARVFPAN